MEKLGAWTRVFRAKVRHRLRRDRRSTRGGWGGRVESRAPIRELGGRGLAPTTVRRDDSS